MGKKNKKKSSKAGFSGFGAALLEAQEQYVARGLMFSKENLFEDNEITVFAEPEDFDKPMMQVTDTGDNMQSDTTTKLQSVNNTNTSKMLIVQSNKKKATDLDGDYQTEYEDGNYLAEMLSDKFCFDVNIDKWRFYNGKIWVKVRDGKMQRVAAEIFKERYIEATKKTNVSDALLKQYIVDSNMTNVKRALAYALSSELVEREDFDIDKDIIIVSNGALNVRTGMLLPHNLGYWATKMIDVNYNADAYTNSRFAMFVDEIFMGDEDVAEYVQTILGGSLLGKPPQMFFLFYGEGSNGKSTFLEAISNVLEPYQYHLPSAELCTKQKYQSAHSAFWSKTVGKRIVMSSELEKGAVLNESYIKNITGGSEISVRDVREKGFSFKPEFTLFIDANDLPKLQGKDYGIKRRSGVVKFPRKFEEWEEDPTLPDVLGSSAEQEAILAWLVEGALRVAENPKIYKQYPYAVHVETEAFRNQKSVEELEDDVYNGFISECVVESPGSGVLSNELHEVFIRYCQAKGYKEHAAIKPEAFGKKIKKYLSKPKHTNGGSLYKNIRIADEWKCTL